MAEMVSHVWVGASGREYRYFVYALPYGFKGGQDGNYIFARQEPEGKWVPVYIGQGDLGDRVGNHHRAECIRRKGATHVHARLNASEADRREEEGDLLAAHPEAYVPAGCNEKEGG